MRKTIASLAVIGCVGALCSINTYADAVSVATSSNAEMIEITEDDYEESFEEDVGIATSSNADKVELDETAFFDYEILADDSGIKIPSEATTSNTTLSNVEPVGGYFISEYEYVLPIAEKEGCKFLYWTEYQDGTGDIFEAGDIFEIRNGRTTLYAQYGELEE